MNHRAYILLLPALIALSPPASAQPQIAASGPDGPLSAEPAKGPPPSTAYSSSAPAVAIDAATRNRVVEDAIAKITENYVFPDKVPAIAKALHAGLAGKYRRLSDAQAFVDAVNGDIEAVANDRHLHLMWSAEPLPPLNAGEPDPAVMAQMVAMMARKNFAIPKVEVLDGNVGYLKMDLFARAEHAGPVLAAAMAFLQHADALIVDLRDNGGGDPGMITMAVSYLVPPGTEINEFHRRGKSANVQMWAVPYVPGGRWSIDKPVYVLTSKDTASGAEEFAYDMQQLKRGTVIGEVTWGGANPGEMVPINDHFAIFVPSGSAVNPISKTNWEGVGVKPDVLVDRAAAIKAAHRLALQKLIDAANGEHRAELQKALEALRPRGAPTHDGGQ